MKHTTTALLCSIASLFAFAQKKDYALITIKIKNTSLLPKKVTIISYEPGDAGNGTQGFTLMPGSEKELSFKQGAKLYTANSKQVDSVMSGERIDSNKPFLIVKKDDNNKTFKL